MGLADLQHAKEQVRQSIDLVDVVGGYLQLRRSGRGYVGLCPWHDDSKPSFQVNPERQTFKCWVCDLGGDVFSFLMRIEGIEFREALEMLADRAGVTLTTPSPQQQAGGVGDKKTLLAACAWAADRFHHCLTADPQGEPARLYLAERGINAESVQKFRLGFAPNQWDWLLTQARATRFSAAVLERVGLAAPRQQGEGFYDRFRGRVMFPIRDPQARVIAFGGRVLPQWADERSAKYVNSPETPLFSKSAQLYGLDLARAAVAQDHPLVVMEGYTDVIMAHQHGVASAVAVLGTALTERHLPLIRRFTDRVALVLDGDGAGRKRASEVLELFVGNPIDLRVLTLPDGLDPCDFIASQGCEPFRRLLSAAPDALEHKLRIVTEGLVSADRTHEASLAVEQVLSTLARARSGGGLPTSAQMVREQHILGRLARETRLSEEGLRSRLVDLRRSSSPATIAAGRRPNEQTTEGGQQSPRAASLPAWERELLELLVADPRCAVRIGHAVHATSLTHPAAQRVLRLLENVQVQTGLEEVDLDRLLTGTEEPDLKSLLVDLDDSRRVKEGAAQRNDHLLRLEELLQQMNQRIERDERRAQIEALRNRSLDPTQEDQALADLFSRLKQTRQADVLSTDG